MKNRLLIVCLSTLFGAGTAFATTSAQHEMSHAIMQAKLGEKAMSLQLADSHLHKIMNCLVGPNGVGFDASAGDPCMGKGLVNDLKGGRFSKDELQQAMEDVQYGLMTRRSSIARNAADLAYHSLRSARAGD